MRYIRICFHGLCAALLIISVAKVVNGDDTKAPEAPKATSAADIKASSPDQLALALEKKRVELMAQEQAIADRSRALDEREADLEKKIKELKELRAGIEASMANNRRDNEERVARTVTVFETMQPKAAAQVLETLDDWLAVEVIKRMDTKKTAKIMNIMDKGRSAKLSELLTGYFHERVPASVSAAAKGANDALRENASVAPQQKPVSSEEKGNGLPSGAKSQ